MESAWPNTFLSTGTLCQNDRLLKLGPIPLLRFELRKNLFLWYAVLAYHCCILRVSLWCTPQGYRPTFYRFTWVQWSFFPGILLHAPPSRKFPLRVGPWGARHLTRFLWCLQTAVKYACNQASLKTLRQYRRYEWRIFFSDCIKPYVFWICQHHVIDTDDIGVTQHVLPKDILKEKSRHWQVMIRLDTLNSSCNSRRICYRIDIYFSVLL